MLLYKDQLVIVISDHSILVAINWPRGIFVWMCGCTAGTRETIGVKVQGVVTYCMACLFAMSKFSMISSTVGYQIDYQIVHLAKMLAYILVCHIYSNQREWDGWAHQPGLTYLSLGCASGPFYSAVCALLIGNSNLLIDPFWPVHLYYVCVCVFNIFIPHNYYPYFNGLHSYTVDYYKYNSLCPYYVVIQISTTLDI